MPERIQEVATNFAEWITYLWVLGLASLGGAVHYFHKISTTKAKFSFIVLVGEILTSAFVGIITFFLCDAANFSWQTTAALVGISGHMGTRALFKFEKIWSNAL